MMCSVAALLLCLPFLAHGYRYTKCELADALRRENIPERELHKWVCMAEYESSFNTRTTDVNMGGKSKDYGLFQINSKWYCDPEDGRSATNGCGHPCSDFLNTDLSDDVACINKIKRMRGGDWGFSDAYMAHCQDETSAYLSECK